MSNTVTMNTVKVGDALPPLDIPITSTLVVAGAIASNDYMPVHHDKAAAQATGMTDVFMNILTTNGLASRFVTDWAGPDAFIRRVATKLGTPNLPSDTMALTGKVVSVDKDAGTVEIEVEGKNAWGNHVLATIVVSLAKGA